MNTDTHAQYAIATWENLTLELMLVRSIQDNSLNFNKIPHHSFVLSKQLIFDFNAK